MFSRPRFREVGPLVPCIGVRLRNPAARWSHCLWRWSGLHESVSIHSGCAARRPSTSGFVVVHEPNRDRRDGSWSPTAYSVPGEAAEGEHEEHESEGDDDGELDPDGQGVTEERDIDREAGSGGCRHVRGGEDDLAERCHRIGERVQAGADGQPAREAIKREECSGEEQRGHEQHLHNDLEGFRLTDVAQAAIDGTLDPPRGHPKTPSSQT